MATGCVVASVDGSNRGDQSGTGEFRREPSEVNPLEEGTQEAQEEAQPEDHPAGDRLIKLHLGCGFKIIPGFINIDLPDNHWEKKPDVEHDISKPLPYPDNYADEIHSYHVVEHFYRWDIGPILQDWYRVLKPGGFMVVECPCLDKVLDLLRSSSGPKRLRGILGLYGAQKHCAPAMVHKWCYSWREMEGILRYAGFETVKRAEPLTHFPERDMRFEASK